MLSLKYTLIDPQMTEVLMSIDKQFGILSFLLIQPDKPTALSAEMAGWSALQHVGHFNILQKAR